jgi:TRAP transporter TAXI family solute receptor
MSRLFKILAPLGVLCLVTFSGSNAGSTTPRRTEVTVAGLIPQPVLKTLSAASGLPVRIVPYEGSVGIIDDVQRGSVDFGAATSDASYLAFTGQLKPDAKPFDTLRGIIVLDLKTIHLMVSSTSRARSIGDLKGLKVSLGPRGAGTPLVAQLLLKMHGVTLDDIDEEYLTGAESAKRLSANTIDAVFMPLIAPSAEAGAAAAAGARMLDIAGPNVERLRLQHPFLLRTRLAQNTYPGQTKAVQTIAVDLLLVCRADTDESLVYSVLKAYFDDLAKATIATDLNRASAMSIPLHAGAARYYRERELSR